MNYFMVEWCVCEFVSCVSFVSESGTENKVMVARAPEFRLELDSSRYRISHLATTQVLYLCGFMRTLCVFP